MFSTCSHDVLQVTYSDLRASKARAGVETDAIATSTTVDLDFTSVRLEVLRRVLSRHTALNRPPALRDSLLSETELRQSCARSYLDLCSDDVDTSDFL